MSKPIGPRKNPSAAPAHPLLPLLVMIEAPATAHTIQITKANIHSPRPKTIIAARGYVAGRAVSSALLSVSRAAVASGVRPPTYVCAGLRVAVPAHPPLVIDALFVLSQTTWSRGQCLCAAASSATSCSEPAVAGACATCVFANDWLGSATATANRAAATIRRRCVIVAASCRPSRSLDSRFHASNSCHDGSDSVRCDRTRGRAYPFL